MGSTRANLPPHVLIFPVPAQGHVNSMLKLAELLCLSNLHITFMISDFSHSRLLKHTTIISHFEKYPGFHFQSITDGLPNDHPRSGEQIMDMFPAIQNITVPLFKQMMIEKKLFASNIQRPITCIIGDGSLSFLGDFAEENQIPLIYFHTISPCSFWAYFCIPELHQAGEICIAGIDMDQMVKSVPGMEGFLRFRDLPSLCRASDINESNLELVKFMVRQTTRAQGLILNAFEDLEGPIVCHIRKHVAQRLFTIGPNHAHLESRLVEKNGDNPISSGSFWEEDRNCIHWLNEQEQKSVIYVSFGSVTMLSREQLLEFWHGLVNSGHKFLWVLRPDSIIGEDEKTTIPTELDAATKERGYIVEWAPQQEVLNHKAVGGFLTHCGWNSTMESLVAGVPMICWPYFGDQTTNSRFVSEVWKIGLDMKDTCDRDTIEKAVKELMEERKNEFLERAENMAKLAQKAVSKGGSSFSNLDDLVDYIRTM